MIVWKSLVDRNGDCPSLAAVILKASGAADNKVVLRLIVDVAAEITRPVTDDAVVAVVGGIADPLLPPRLAIERLFHAAQQAFAAPRVSPKYSHSIVRRRS
jgi:hypothetical protein